MFLFDFIFIFWCLMQFSLFKNNGNSVMYNYKLSGRHPPVSGDYGVLIPVTDACSGTFDKFQSQLVLQLCWIDFNVPGRVRIIWSDQQLNKANTLWLSVTMACNFMIAQPLMTSEKFHLPYLTHKAWILILFSDTFQQYRLIGSSLQAD